MRQARQERRLREANSKALYDLFVEYLFSIQDKGKEDADSLKKAFNIKWTVRCKKFKANGIDLNPKGFMTLANDKSYIKELRAKLELLPPKQNWLQRIFH